MRPAPKLGIQAWLGHPYAPKQHELFPAIIESIVLAREHGLSADLAAGAGPGAGSARMF
jgi:hypothetical protein